MAFFVQGLPMDGPFLFPVAQGKSHLLHGGDGVPGQHHDGAGRTRVPAHEPPPGAAVLKRAIGAGLSSCVIYMRGDKYRYGRTYI